MEALAPVAGRLNLGGVLTAKTRSSTAVVDAAREDVVFVYSK